jgi:CBS domain-containing protein
MTEDRRSRVESLEEIAGFLSHVEAFETLSGDQLVCLAAALTPKLVATGETMIVEGGPPTRQLYVLRDGSLDLLRRDSLVTVMTAGELLGYPSLLTGTAPAFTVRARSDCALYCIPGDLGVELLSREDGVRWLATTQRDALLYAARSLSPLPEVQTLPVTSMVRGAPQLCDPVMTISEAATMMSADGRSAVLVRTRDGLGIVTDVDLREKVVAGGVPRDAPVSAIMSAPVHTIGAGTLAAEASVAMLTFGVGHLPVVADDGTVVGIVSAGDLMSLEARNPFALRHALHRARDEDELVAAAGDIPTLFVDLLDARLDAPVLCRVLTILHDSLTVRLLELAFERHGAPPVDYAWLVFGSAARNELTLASDQDNGLAYADTDDPAVDEYFRRVADDVNAGLTRCGVEPDSHAVLASVKQWRRTLSGWRKVFSSCLEGDDLQRVLSASVCFDYRQAAGRLYVEQALSDVMREAPEHRKFMQWLSRLGSDLPPSIGGFRQKLDPEIDIKKGGLLPIQNLARYHALSRGITIQATLDRLAAARDLDAEGAECVRTLRESYLTIKQLQLEHHADAVREGRPPDNTIDTGALRPLTRANLQEALRAVAAEQTRFPRLAAGWRNL